MLNVSRRSFLQLAGLFGTAAAVGYQPSRSAAQGVMAARGTYGVGRALDLTPEQEASRFLAQATLGANLEMIQEVATMGNEAWLEQQFGLPTSNTLPLVEAGVVNDPEDPKGLLIPPMQFRWSYWQQVMTGADVLRHRMGLALSEIFVISTRVDELFDLPRGVSSYYDMLLKNGFGNFRDLLFDVTMHPCMGLYLSHVRNRKSDPSLNRFPDENYAREVMQLFTIGLFELNQDGTHKVDGNGEPIPTYTNAEITEFAKVFTGLTYALEDDEEIMDEELFLEAGEVLHKPMVMYEPEHEPGSKNLLNGFVVPAGQSGMQDINNAVDNLFNHPNVGPFIGRLLIQRLVKSNPSPAYISRVAAAFHDNGSGVRGDMKALIKAILLDSEARDTSHMSDPTHGMLREPFVRYVHLCRAFNAASQNGTYRNNGEMAQEMLQQHPFDSPSVFNFFSPSYQPLGPIADAGLVAPEFQITTSYTAISAINFMNEAIVYEELMNISNASQETCEDAGTECEEPTEADIVYLNLDQEIALAESDPDALINRLDLILTYGTLSPQIRTIIQNTINQLDDTYERVTMALYLIMISPDYAILK
ncbi:MAG: DUF1800 family protein [Ardenticatenaceae bacterium]